MYFSYLPWLVSDMRRLLVRSVSLVLLLHISFFANATSTTEVAPNLSETQQSEKKTQSFWKRFVAYINSTDTTYIAPNEYNYAAMLQNTNFYQSYRLRATNEEEHTQSIRFSPSPSVKVGPYFGWRWIFLGYTFDVGNPQSAGKSTEFNLSLYSSLVGIDLVHIKNSGNFRIKNASGFGPTAERLVKNAEFKGAETYTSSINLYYVFNHQRFSYPAAFAQSTVQKKSCGSWMLGLRYDKQKIKFEHTRLPSPLLSSATHPLIDEMKINNIEYLNYSVSVGYAYNWVFARNFLLSASVSPSLGFTQSKGEDMWGESLWLNMKNMSFDFVSRLGIVWNTGKWFAGFSAVNHLFDYKRNKISLTNSINYFNLYVGFNFNRRKNP